MYPKFYFQAPGTSQIMGKFYMAFEISSNVGKSIKRRKSFLFNLSIKHIFWFMLGKPKTWILVTPVPPLIICNVVCFGFRGFWI